MEEEKKEEEKKEEEKKEEEKVEEKKEEKIPGMGVAEEVTGEALGIIGKIGSFISGIFGGEKKKK